MSTSLYTSISIHTRGVESIVNSSRPVPYLHPSLFFRVFYLETNMLMRSIGALRLFLIPPLKQQPCFLVNPKFPISIPTPKSPIQFIRLNQSRLMSAAAGGAAAAGASGKRIEGDREILVQHLLLKEDDMKLLIELQKRVLEGEDLSDLAVEFSICPSKEEGGMLGWVRKGQMVPEFEEAAFKAPLEKVVRCKSKFGWHLLQVLSEREEAKLKDVEVGELHLKMQDPDFVESVQLIDVREPDEVEKASLPGFQVFPLRQFGSWGPEFATKFDSNKDTYVLCHHGVRSLQVARWLQTQGFKRIFNVSGGIHAYSVNVDPSIPTY